MARIIALSEVVESAFAISRVTPSTLTDAFALAGNRIHAATRQALHGECVAVEGLFLSMCAHYEEVVRDIIDEAASQIVAKITDFALLPKKMRDAHLSGCIAILKGHKYRFQHIPLPSIVASLSSCHATPITPYALLFEALSSNSSNFRSDVLKEIAAKVGCKDIWGKMSGEAVLLAHFSTTSSPDAMRFAMSALDSIMSARNLAIHRGAAFSPPTSTEVVSHAKFLIALISCLAAVLTTHVAGF